MSILKMIFYQPLYNGLILIYNFIPGHDLGISIILLTLLIRFVLYPLNNLSIRSQKALQDIQPKIKQVQKEFANNKEQQAKELLKLYKEHKVNPFSGCLLVLIQIPIIFALYYVFYKGINFEGGHLYSFVHIPESVNMVFLGILDISAKSLPLAILAGVSQYLQAHFMPKPAFSESPKGSTPSFSESFTKSMHTQMKYIFPFVVAFIAYSISGAVALYWITSNLFMVGQQIYVKREKNFKTVIK